MSTRILGARSWIAATPAALVVLALSAAAGATGNGSGRSIAPPDVIRSRTDLQLRERIAATRVTALRGQRLVVPLKDVPQLADRIELLTRTGDRFEPAPDRVRTEDDGSKSLEIDRGTLYVLRVGTEQPGPVRLTQEGVALPDQLLYTPTKEEYPGDDPPVRAFELRLAVQEDPVPWHDDDSAYSTNLIAWLAEVDPQPTVATSAPTMPAIDPPLTVLFMPSRSSVQDDAVEIRQAGTAGRRTTRVSIAQAIGDAGVRATSDLGSRDVTFEIGQGEIRLDLVPAKTTIRGFGLETTDLTVTRSTVDGTPVDEGDLTVSLQTSAGHLDSMVTIPDGADRATVELRSEGVGAAEVTAVESFRIRSGTITVRFAWPVLLLVFTLIGASVGGAVGAWRERNRRRSGDESPKWWPRVLVGLASGLFLELAIALGLHMVEFLAVSRTEFGAFVLAFAGGWGGTEVIDRVCRALGLIPAADGDGDRAGQPRDGQ